MFSTTSEIVQWLRVPLPSTQAKDMTLVLRTQVMVLTTAVISALRECTLSSQLGGFVYSSVHTYTQIQVYT